MGRFETVFQIGLQLRHWWHNSRPFLETVFNNATGGAIQDRFQKRSSITPPKFLLRLCKILPKSKVAQFETVFKIGLQLRHRWRNSRPFLETVFNCATGGVIRDRFQKRSSITPPKFLLIFFKILPKSKVAQFETVFKIGLQLRHHRSSIVPPLVFNCATIGLQLRHYRSLIAPPSVLQLTDGGAIENRWWRN